MIPEERETLLKEGEMLEAPFLGRIVDAIVKKFKGLRDLNTRRQLGKDWEEFSKRIKV